MPGLILKKCFPQRIRHYMDWSVNSIQYLAMKEVHSTFLECFLKTAANFSKQQDDGGWPKGALFLHPRHTFRDASPILGSWQIPAPGRRAVISHI